jgi:hypothetical protein
LKALLEGSMVKLTLPASLDSEHQKMLDELNAKSGKVFDTSYDQIQVKAHRDAVALFEDPLQAHPAGRGQRPHHVQKDCIGTWEVSGSTGAALPYPVRMRRFPLRCRSLGSGRFHFVRRLHSYYGEVRLLGFVHHRLRFLTFPIPVERRAGTKGNADQQIGFAMGAHWLWTDYKSWFLGKEHD